ncbi:MAG: hypothetical protein IJH41_05925 [Eubacterium sp.]|nr:hypothetical protein [Eubacterium sp.]
MESIVITPQDFEEIKDAVREIAETTDAIACMIRDYTGDEYETLYAVIQRGYTLAHRLDLYMAEEGAQNE